MNKKQQHSRAQRVLENWTGGTLGLGYRYGLPDGEGEGKGKAAPPCPWAGISVGLRRPSSGFTLAVITALLVSGALRA